MPNHSLGGAVNHTGYYTGPWGASASNYVATGGYGMPAGRGDLGGNQPIYIGTIYPGYYSGAFSGCSIVYFGVETAGGTLFGSSGGTCEFRQKFVGGGTMYYGRNMGNGFSVYNGRSGSTLSGGGVVGSVDWAQVSTAVQSFSASRGAGAGQINVNFTSPADNGGSAVAYFVIQTAPAAGGPWTTYGTTLTGTNVITMPSGFYFVRVYAVNGVGSSVAATTPVAVQTGGGGQRYNGSSFVAISIARRFNGTAFVDLSIRRRWTGSAWVDITN